MKKLLFTIFCILHPLIANAIDRNDSNKVYNTPTVTVTSTKAEFGKSPVPFSEISAVDIKNFNTDQDLPSLLSNLPSVVFTSQSANGIGYNSIMMRGFDQRRIAVMINGVPQNDPEDHNVYWIDFPDLSTSLDNIQVQRGGGLTSYGSASIGGSINLSTSNFVNQKGIKLITGFGLQEFGCDCGNRIFQGLSNKQSIEFSSGLVNNYAFYGRLSRISSLGYKDRADADLSSYHFSAVRFDENVTTQINIFGGPFKDGLAYNGVPKSYVKDLNVRKANYASWSYDSTGRNVYSVSSRRQEEREEFSQPHFEIINDWQISKNLFFKNTAFYYTGDGYYIYDGSWADTTYLRLTYQNGIYPAKNPVGTLIKANVTNNQGGIIPQLIYTQKNNEITIGGELRLHRSDHWGKIDFAEDIPAGLVPDYKFYSYNGERDIYSIYLRDKYQINEEFTLTAEIQNINHRYAINNEKAGLHFMTFTNKEGKTVGATGEDIFNVWYNFINPKLALNYKINDNINYYLYLGYTSREPRMRNIYAADDSFWGALPLFEGKINTDNSYSYDFTKPLVKEEKMFDIEIGHNYMFNNDDRISINLYYMDYRDELVKSGKLDIFGMPIDGNVPKTRHMGIEIDGKYSFAKIKNFNFYLNANLTYSKNRIMEYEFITNSGDKVSLKDNQIAGFPDLMGNLGVFVQNKEFFAGLSFKYVGESRTDNFGDMINNNSLIMNHLANDWNTGYYADNNLDAYFVCNADINYKFKLNPLFNEVKVQLHINNLFNELYATSGEGKDFFIAAERAFYFGLEFNF